MYKVLSHSYEICELFEGFKDFKNFEKYLKKKSFLKSSEEKKELFRKLLSVDFNEPTSSFYLGVLLKKIPPINLLPSEKPSRFLTNETENTENKQANLTVKKEVSQKTFFDLSLYFRLLIFDKLKQTYGNKVEILISKK